MGPRPLTPGPGACWRRPGGPPRPPLGGAPEQTRGAPAAERGPPRLPPGGSVQRGKKAAAVLLPEGKRNAAEKKRGWATRLGWRAGNGAKNWGGENHGGKSGRQQTRGWKGPRKNLAQNRFPAAAVGGRGGLGRLKCVGRKSGGKGGRRKILLDCAGIGLDWQSGRGEKMERLKIPS